MNTDQSQLLEDFMGHAGLVKSRSRIHSVLYDFGLIPSRYGAYNVSFLDHVMVFQDLTNSYVKVVTSQPYQFSEAELCSECAKHRLTAVICDPTFSWHNQGSCWLIAIVPWNRVISLKRID
jgi:hypothetical protein